MLRFLRSVFARPAIARDAPSDVPKPPHAARREPQSERIALEDSMQHLMQVSRRRFLKTFALLAAAVPLLKLDLADAGALPQLGSDDPMAKALGYVADAASVDPIKVRVFKAGSRCSNCALYSGAAGAAFGPCSVFPGKSVSKDGWCTAYAALD